MRNYDGGQWRLTWSKSATGFRGWVESHPEIAADAPTFDEMADELYDLVSDNLQGGEWTADWAPPPPAKPGERGGVLESHVRLVWEGRFVSLCDPRDLFESYCDRCGMPSGARSSLTLRAMIELPGNLCGDFDTAPGKLMIMSRELSEQVEMLAPGSAEFRPVKRMGRGRKARMGRGRKAFVEPVVHSDRPEPVALRGEIDGGWKCPACDYQYLYHSHLHHRAWAFYRRAELATHSPLFWLTNAFGSVEACVTTAWWLRHRREAWARGVGAEPIGVAEDADIEPKPKLREHEGAVGGCRSQWRERQLRLTSGHGILLEPWE